MLLADNSIVHGCLLTSTLVLARIASLVFVLPGMSRHYVPWRPRMALVVVLTSAVLCVLPPLAKDAVPLASYPARLLHEVIVGISLGLVPAVMIWGLQMATAAVQGMTGLPGTESQASADQGSVESALQRLFTMTVLTVFFLSAGHRLVLEATLDSFHWLPPGQYVTIHSMRELLVDLFAASFALGARAMSPIAIALAMGMITLMAVSRVVPQLGYLSVGMSVQTIILVTSILLCFGHIIGVFDHSLTSTLEAAAAAWQNLIQLAEQP